MSDSESDIELKTATKKPILQKTPSSPTEEFITNNATKKTTTKIMIYDALKELKSRKGVSLQAIKKFLKEKYNVNTDKINLFIKRSITNGVKDGTIIQVKGIGASGSFKLAPPKEKPKKKKAKKIIEKPNEKEMEKAKKPKKTEEILLKMKSEAKVPKKKKSELETAGKKEKVQKQKPEKSSKEIKKKMVKVSKTNKKEKMASSSQTPARKKGGLERRKSIGSIIKKPKMKPQAT